MLFPSAAVKQKAKEGLCEVGRGIVLPFSKTQPLRFWFLCAVGMRRLPYGKKQAFVSFGLQKKENSRYIDYLPAHSRGEPSSFPVAEKNQNATAAPDAMKGSGLANVVRAAPANAEQRLGRVCEWTICGGFKFDFFIKFFKI